LISSSRPTQDSSKKKKSNDPDIELVIWDLNQNNGKTVMNFRPPLIDLSGLFITSDSSSLIIAGKDM